MMKTRKEPSARQKTIKKFPVLDAVSKESEETECDACFRFSGNFEKNNTTLKFENNETLGQENCDSQKKRKKM